ncbi:hypothetical protein IMG5_001170 [Ichthyophthirius multifiliis]|uniref:CXXC-rich protein n=1 Tax=Ichthyophthirius multifiliis TaxID=5932 RepID=G0QIQ8_ICHMU|nr:hypothetical protein IMG5_001170 [Ichthyophthirius multifiliis]EGR34888.1 hypothetical protein IMG5_001170 [Ichthyophthirius multifiliis]|eukprot:XP_004040192.1 hypothetical protein IMG5_001170 [Ichthyophthirius multifiliis]
MAGIAITIIAIVILSAKLCDNSNSNSNSNSTCNCDCLEGSSCGSGDCNKCCNSCTNCICCCCNTASNTNCICCFDCYFYSNRRYDYDHRYYRSSITRNSYKQKNNDDCDCNCCSCIEYHTLGEDKNDTIYVQKVEVYCTQCNSKLRENYENIDKFYQALTFGIIGMILCAFGIGLFYYYKGYR